MSGTKKYYKTAWFYDSCLGTAAENLEEWLNSNDVQIISISHGYNKESEIFKETTTTNLEEWLNSSDVQIISILIVYVEITQLSEAYNCSSESSKILPTEKQVKWNVLLEKAKALSFQILTQLTHGNAVRIATERDELIEAIEAVENMK